MNKNNQLLQDISVLSFSQQLLSSFRYVNCWNCLTTETQNLTSLNAFNKKYLNNIDLTSLLYGISFSTLKVMSHGTNFTAEKPPRNPWKNQTICTGVCHTRQISRLTILEV